MKGGSAFAVPESSLLSTATGDFVFTVNGDHFQRTQITIGDRADGWASVSDGLLEGDQVVTNGVRELWRIELQNTKGGYACCAVEKKE
jgi:multidrug efflux pump subunit AcrA (membrane-fusion protein)